MRGVRVLFHLDTDDLPEEVADEVLAIPGVVLSDTISVWTADGYAKRVYDAPCFQAPVNAVGLIKGILKGAEVPFRLEPVRTKRLRLGKDVRDPTQIPGVKPEAISRLKSYQREALDLFLKHGGGLAWMPCGSGKTFMAILWSLATPEPGRILVVTRSATTHQWLSQYVDWTSVTREQIALVEGTEGYHARQSPPPYRYLRAYRRLPDELDADPSDDALDAWIQGAYKAAGVRMAPASQRAKAIQVWRTIPDQGEPCQVLANLRGRVEEQPPRETEAVWRVLQTASLIRCAEAVDPAEWKPWQIYCSDADAVMDWWDYTDEAPVGHDEWPDLKALVKDDRASLEKRFRALVALEAGRRFFGESKGRVPVVRGEVVGLTAEPTPEELQRFLNASTEEAMRRRIDSLRGVPNFSADTRIVIVGSGVLSQRAQLLASWQPHTVILDESHTFKNPSRWARKPDDSGFERKDHISAWADLVAEKADRVLLLSATPQEHAVRDWWAQLDLVDKGSFGRYKPPPPDPIKGEPASFAGAYCGGYRGQYGYFDKGQSRVAELKARLKSVVYEVSTARTHAELPPLLEERVYLPLASAARVKIDRREFRAAQKRGPSALVELQLAINAQMKEPELLRVVLQEAQSDGLRVMVMMGRKAQVERLGAQIRKYAKADYPVWVAHGETSIEDRRKIVEAYRASTRGGCIVGTSDAWGEAIDGLQVTDLALVASLPITIGKLVQLRGRWHRLGGTKSCIVRYYVMEETIDEDVLERTLAHAKAVDRMSDSTDLAALISSLETQDEEALLASLAARIMAGVEEDGSSPGIDPDADPGVEGDGEGG